MKEAIHIRLNPNIRNRDNRAKTPEAWMATVIKHQSQRHTANQQSQRKPWYMETMAWIEMHQLQQTTMINNACAAKNGMLFPVKPEFFNLNQLQCRLLVPRLVFQKILQAPRGNQLKIKGKIVNVPADVRNSVNR